MWIDSYRKITWLDWGRFAAQGCKAGQSSRGVRCISQSLESSVHPAWMCQSLGIRGNIGNQTPKVKGVGYGMMVGLTWLTLIHPMLWYADMPQAGGIRCVFMSSFIPDTLDDPKHLFTLLTGSMRLLPPPAAICSPGHVCFGNSFSKKSCRHSRQQIPHQSPSDHAILPLRA